MDSTVTSILVNLLRRGGIVCVAALGLWMAKDLPAIHATFCAGQVVEVAP